MKNVILVIPGLGVRETTKRIRKIVSWWSGSHTSVHLFDSKWKSNEAADEKAERLQQFYESHRQSGRVELVGFSAGGALATHLFINNQKIDKVILISAKIRGSNSIGPEYSQRAPALIGSVKKSEEALSRLNAAELSKFVSYKPIYDGVVPLDDMSVDGMNKKRVPIIGHSASIGYALIFQINREVNPES